MYLDKNKLKAYIKSFLVLIVCNSRKVRIIMDRKLMKNILMINITNRG